MTLTPAEAALPARQLRLRSHILHTARHSSFSKKDTLARVFFCLLHEKICRKSLEKDAQSFNI